MVKVFYGNTANSFLGGVFFYDGVAEFAVDAEGIAFANRYYKKFEVSAEITAPTVEKVEVVKPEVKKKSTKKVK